MKATNLFATIWKHTLADSFAKALRSIFFWQKLYIRRQKK